MLLWNKVETNKISFFIVLQICYWNVVEVFQNCSRTYLGLTPSRESCGLLLKYMTSSSRTLCSAAFFLISSWYSMYRGCSRSNICVRANPNPWPERNCLPITKPNHPFLEKRRWIVTVQVRLHFFTATGFKISSLQVNWKDNGCCGSWRHVFKLLASNLSVALATRWDSYTVQGEKRDLNEKWQVFPFSQ